MKTQRAIGMEFVGSLILALAIVGSGQMAANLTTDSGLRLFINALATGIGLAFVIRLGVKTSGSHFNPVVTLIMLYLKRIKLKLSLGYILAQITGGITGVAIANFIFDQSALAQSATVRSGSNLFVSEVLATAGLVWIILRFPKRDDLIAIYAPLWIFGGILFTSSTAFANPAMTIARSFTTSITGISNESVLAFITAQLIGAVIGLAAALYITNPKLEANE
jgi:glycerol uptake facilitator-like aquaporin